MMNNTLGYRPPHRFHGAIRGALHAIGHHRHRGFHGRSGFRPGGFGPGGFGTEDGPSFARKLGADELQLVLLALLAGQPAHGYELIRTLEERSGGFYKPSSGMVYPALTYLDEIGQATAAAEGNRKLYTITAAGAAHLAAHRAEADAILAALSRIGARMGEVRDAFAGVNDPGADPMYTARGALKHALIRAQGCAPEEARRIAAILERATAEIIGKKD